jgi:hypothetical protein
MSGTTPVSMAVLLAASGAARAVSTPPPPDPVEAEHQQLPVGIEDEEPCPTAEAA